MANTLRSLFLQLEERNRELMALSERAINVQEEERRAIAQTLHDDTGQALSMLIVHLDRLEVRVPAGQEDLRKQISEARSLAAATLAELRRILSGLRPAILDDLGAVFGIWGDDLMGYGKPDPRRKWWLDHEEVDGELRIPPSPADKSDHQAPEA